MGTARTLIARAVVALAILAPWLAFLQPVHLLGRALLVMLLLAASFRGWGCGLAALIRRPVEPALSVAWGIGVVAAFLGGSIAASLHAEIPILVIGVVLHDVFTIVRFQAASSCVEAALRSEAMRWWIAPALLILAIGGLHVLGAAGGGTLRPFDDDGHVLAQVRRLLDTGTLADPIGYARATQLGAGIAFDALGAVFGDLAFVRVVDALGFVLVLVLVSRAIGVRDAMTSLWASVVVVTLGFFAVPWLDPSPLWLPIALALALAQTVDGSAAEPATLMPAGLVAGALIALRLEWAPFAVVIAAAAWRPREYPRPRLLRAGVLVAATLLVVIPYVLVRITAWSRTTRAVFALVVPAQHSRLVTVVGSLAILAAAVPLTALVTAHGPSRIVRWCAVAAVASAGCVLGRLTAIAPYYDRYLWPIFIATALVLVIEGTRSASALALVLATAAVLLGYDARFAHGHQRLRVHYGDLVTSLAYVRGAMTPPATDPDYERLLALAPQAPLAVWVVRPERLDYKRHAIIDLRVPRISRERARPWQPEKADGVIRVLRAAKLHYLLIEDDGAAQRYADENPVAAVMCGDHCVDPLERMLSSQRLLGSAGATRLYELHW